MRFKVPESNKLKVNFSAVGGGFRSSLGDAIGRAHENFVGCFLSNEGPSWATAIEKYERDSFLANAPIPRFSEVSGLASGRGKRAVNWNYAMMLDPRAYLGNQDYGNCTFVSMGWKTMTMIMAYRILGLKLEERWRARHGSVWYCTRGHCSQGSALSQAAKSVLNLGLQVMDDKYDGYDFSDENTDEKYGNSWCRTGPPQALVDQTKTNKHLAVALLDDGSTDAWMDVLYNGGSIHTGSVTTARKDGDPVSSFGSVGPHAQSILGYDDTQEFKDWYYGRTGKRRAQRYVTKNWPDHLWGRQPQGAFVLPLRGTIQRMGNDAYAYGPDSEGFRANTITWETLS